MKLLTQALIHTAIVLTLAANQKDSDEGRPYEFGFTIDGQQHRHEKKDQNGIIQGEFGFITGDGVYHVTVYATDENGNFKILSMRNIRISAPLDGSPAWGPISPEAGKYLSKIPSTTAAPVRQFERLQEQPIAPQGSVTTTRRPFTTQSTIKPACAGCGYVTTSAPLRPGDLPAFQRQGTLQGPQAPVGIPRQPGPVQRPGGSYPGQPGPGLFQQQSLSNQISPQLPPDVELLPPSASPGSFPAGPQSIQQQYQNIQTGSVQQSFQSGQTGSLQQSFQSGQKDNYQQSFQSGQTGSLQQSYQNGQVSGEQPNLLLPVDGGRTLQTLTQNNVKQNLVVPVDVRYDNDNFPLNAPPFGAGPNPILQPGEVSKLPPISVGDNVIHVGGKNPKDIPIKDKYPGMVDGLPAGVGESDVKDILYKFKYTVGFHGHYERGLKNGAKIGGYFVNGRDGISRVVTYVADENGYRPKFKFINLGLDSSDTPKEGTEKTFGLKDFEFVWYPIE